MNKLLAQNYIEYNIYAISKPHEFSDFFFLSGF